MKPAHPNTHVYPLRLPPPLADPLPPALPRIWFVLALLLLAVTGREALAQGRPPTPVRTAPVEQRTLGARRMVTGDLRAAQRSNVAAQEAGVVVELPFREGQRVEAGDVLARLDARRLKILVAEAESNTAVAVALETERAAVEAQRERDVALVRETFERGGANERELQDAQSELAVAAARREQARLQIALATAQADLLRERLADMTILAPYAGVIVARTVELGEWLGEGDAVVELVATDTLEAWLDLPQQLYASTRAAELPIAIELEATGTTIETTDRRIVPLVDPRARSFTVIAVLPNDDGTLSPGMSVTAWVPVGGTAEMLTVPKDAVLRNDAGPYIYIARPTGPQGHQATPVRIEVLFGEGDRVVVRADGLAHGDLAIVEGNERLFPMTPVAPIGTTASAPTTGGAR